MWLRLHRCSFHGNLNIYNLTANFLFFWLLHYFCSLFQDFPWALGCRSCVTDVSVGDGHYMITWFWSFVFLCDGSVLGNQSRGRHWPDLWSKPRSFCGLTLSCWDLFWFGSGMSSKDPCVKVYLLVWHSWEVVVTLRGMICGKVFCSLAVRRTEGSYLQPLIFPFPQMMSISASSLTLSHRSKANGDNSCWIQTHIIMSPKKPFLFFVSLFKNKLSLLLLTVKIAKTIVEKFLFHCDS